MKAPLMQDTNGQIQESYSISASLDFPSVGPQHAYLQSIGRAEYVSATDDEALEAFKLLCRKEGIIPALESSHALAYALKLAYDKPDKQQILVVNLSGHGDKDIFTVHDVLNRKGRNLIMTSRYTTLFENLANKNQGAFIPFVTIGDPNKELSFEIIETLI